MRVFRPILTVLISSESRLGEPKIVAWIARVEKERVEAAWPFVRPLFYELTKFSPLGSSRVASISPLQCLCADP